MSLLDYHHTTTKELIALTNKVRSLVPHWPSDGQHKEAVLKNVMRRFLPERFIIGTGFVIKQNRRRGDHLRSKQIDLIIYDNSSPVLFKEGDFVILTPDGVRGIIEVKANLQNQDLIEIVRQANENGEFIHSGKSITDKKLKFFNGIFSYEGYENQFNLGTFGQNFNQGNVEFRARRGYNNFKVNHVSLNKDWFIKYWEADATPHSIYNIEDLSFPFFISNLNHILANKSVTKNNFIWFVHDKELNLEGQF